MRVNENGTTSNDHNYFIIIILTFSVWSFSVKRYTDRYMVYDKIICLHKNFIRKALLFNLYDFNLTNFIRDFFAISMFRLKRCGTDLLSASISILNNTICSHFSHLYAFYIWNQRICLLFNIVSLGYKTNTHFWSTAVEAPGVIISNQDPGPIRPFSFAQLLW